MSTGFLSCSANTAIILASGDNDGFQVTPAGACASGGIQASDIASSSASGTTCGDVNADRHIFEAYGISLPAGATIHGIEVRLDAYTDNSNNAQAMCVEISWNNGANWTAAQVTPQLNDVLSTYTLGSPTDTWGRIWIANQLANGVFRIRITNTAANQDRDFYLDWVAVQVTYSP